MVVFSNMSTEKYIQPVPSLQGISDSTSKVEKKNGRTLLAIFFYHFLGTRHQLVRQKVLRHRIECFNESYPFAAQINYSLVKDAFN